MHSRTRSLALASVFVTAAAVAQDAGPPATVASLRFEPHRKFDLVLPVERWTTANGLRIPHAGGEAFVTESDGIRLHVDTDGDGRVDEKIQGARGFALLNAERPDGERFAYALRFRRNGKAWEYATSGLMSGSLHGVPIALIDLDQDGRFDEVGVDGMIVGGGKAASFLSEVVNLKGELHRIEVDRHGSEIRALPYDGPAGSLRVRGGLSLPGKLVAAVVSDAEGRFSFEVGNVAELRVPAGSYRLSGGYAVSGGDSARLRAGDMQPLVVEDGGTAALERWGAPLIAEFDHTRAGDIVTVQPSVRFVGRGGEEWYELLPDAKSPKLEFIDGERLRPIASARFQGC